MKSSSRKYIEFGALCALAAGILWWFGRQLDWGQVRVAVSQSNGYLLALAVLVISLAYLFRAYRWGALLAPLGPTRLSHLFAATTVGFGAVFILGRMGEVVRPVVLPMRDPGVRASSSFVTIMVERIYDTMAVVVLFAVNLLWFTPPANVGNEFSKVRIAGVVLLILAIAGVAALTWFRRKSKSAIAWFETRLERLGFVPVRLRRAFIHILEQLAKSLRVLVDGRELAVTTAWTAVIWAGIALANWLVLRAFGLRFGMSEAIFILGWSLVGSLVPTPGGAAGAFHYATAAGLMFLGVARETAAAVSIVTHVINFGPAIIFGFFYVVRGDINLTRLRSMMSPEAVEHAVEDESNASDELLMTRELETAASSE
ncbi:MAG: flippase-like domain-containing protein [Pyrinomonadaceae bacterium]|nr:flippase-like domain-containing protein [Pyrinomonadaceae bacterium]